MCGKPWRSIERRYPNFRTGRISDKRKNGGKRLKNLTNFSKNKALYKIERVGVSCGGPLNAYTGEIVSSPNLPLWLGFNIVEFVRKR